MKNKFVPTYDGSEPFVFVSFSHRNLDETLGFVRQLKEDGFRVWYDEGIDPGTEWDENIAAHVETCEFFLALLSEDYLASSNCKDELNYARELEKNRVLIYLEDVELPGGMRMRLSRLQAIHKYSYEDPDAFFEKLYKTPGIEVCRETEEKTEPETEQPPAAEPAQTQTEAEAQADPEADAGPAAEEKETGEADAAKALDGKEKEETAGEADLKTTKPESGKQPEKIWKAAREKSEESDETKDGTAAGAPGKRTEPEKRTKAEKAKEGAGAGAEAGRGKAGSGKIVGKIIGWVLTAVFVFIAFLQIFSWYYSRWTWIARILLPLVIAFFACPPADRMLRRKKWYESRRWIRTVVIIIAFLLFIIFQM